jgi:hypothetical protein
MYKTNVKVYIYYANICKHEHENNMIRLWCKIVPNTNIEHIEGNESSYYYFIPFWSYFIPLSGPSSRKLPRRLLYVHQIRKLFRNFLN